MKFHGSRHWFDSPQAGPDGLFWVCEHPAVAQTYIKGGYITHVAALPCSVSRGMRIPPYDLGWAPVLKALGFHSDDYLLLRDSSGRPQSWVYPPDAPTYAQASEFLNSLGYKEDRESLFRLKVDPVLDVVLGADFRTSGYLYIIEGEESLRFFDLSTGDGDLSSPQHLRYELFARLQNEGFDGVIIDDFCQSPNKGNVGHRSWGIFAPALGRIRFQSIPACEFDWPKNAAVGSMLSTPEFEGFQKEVKCLI